MGQSVLLIEDNSSFRQAVSTLLAKNGYTVAEAPTGKAGLALAVDQKPDLVILDLVLPGLQGMDVCRRLKEDAGTAAIPILILTGNDRDGQDITCRDEGADDYLTKPVKSERLLAHCRALLRRISSEPARADCVITLGLLTLDYPRKLVVIAGKEYSQLTPKEFGMLFELARRSPEPLDRTSLYREVWGGEPPSEMSLDTVDAHAHRGTAQAQLGSHGVARLPQGPGLRWLLPRHEINRRSAGRLGSAAKSYCAAATGCSTDSERTNRYLPLSSPRRA